MRPYQKNARRASLPNWPYFICNAIRQRADRHRPLLLANWGSQLRKTDPRRICHYFFAHAPYCDLRPGCRSRPFPELRRSLSLNCPKQAAFVSQLPPEIRSSFATCRRLNHSCEECEPASSLPQRLHSCNACLNLSSFEHFRPKLCRLGRREMPFRFPSSRFEDSAPRRFPMRKLLGQPPRLDTRGVMRPASRGSLLQRASDRWTVLATSEFTGF